MDAPTQFELSEFEKLLEPLAVWCVRMGAGHRQFSQFMKDQFFKAAYQELTQNGAQLVTDSALCLASGLHRGDVIQMRKAYAGTRQTQGIVSRAYQSRISPASQVVARWLAMGWSKTLPLKGPEPSFSNWSGEPCSRKTSSSKTCSAANWCRLTVAKCACSASSKTPM